MSLAVGTMLIERSWAKDPAFFSAWMKRELATSGDYKMPPLLTSKLRGKWGLTITLWKIVSPRSRASEIRRMEHLERSRGIVKRVRPGILPICIWALAPAFFSRAPDTEGPEPKYISLAMMIESTTDSVEKCDFDACKIFSHQNVSAMNCQPLLSSALSPPETSERALVLEVSGLSKVYRGRIRTITAFENIAFSLRQGEIVVVLGPSGCGKSSFLKTVAGLEPATRGSVRALNHIVSAPIPQFGVVFQQPVLFPWLNVRQNVGFALALKSGPQLPKERRNQAVDEALSDVGLSQASHARPRHLSGGMAQRVALARVLVRQPELLLLDEPFSALDAITRLEMQKLLLKVVENRGIATLLVTHDIDEALLLADRILLMSRNPGRFVKAWQVSTVKPRFDRATELTQLRLSILAALSEVIDRPSEPADPSVLIPVGR